ncbi:MAG: zinc-ribbon domain-containing protein, partial [Oscillospiraceae bacterium]|nr:zinc-ribbon domain-containing protein [Oscillospiraceae bacterium]
MSYYCPNCGLEVADGVNYCPSCGASMTGGLSSAARTAATVGGVVLGASALNNLAWQLGHRRRPMY